MGRLINADKLIEEIESYRGDIFADEIVNLIKQMPTVDVPDINVGEWIPIDDTSNIPEERKVYLVTYVTHRGRRYVRSVECSYSGETPRHIEWSKRINGTVTAYMTLPEPYKPE